MKLKKENVLIIGDLHEPFTLTGYLEHCKRMQYKHRCGTVVFIGDIVDHHSISYHEHDPDLWSPAVEMEKAEKKLKRWFKAFPQAYVVQGNHDELPDRKGKTLGLPKRLFKNFSERWNLPKGWKAGFEFTLYDVLYKHAGAAGDIGHLKEAIACRMSVVFGHGHSVAGIAWNCSIKDRIFGVNVGCGIDRNSLAFAYGKAFKKKPMISCAVVLDKGRLPLIEPMELGSRK